jgi:hypothetical protein
MTKPIVSAAKFTAYRKAHKFYSDLWRDDDVNDVKIIDRLSAAREAEKRTAKPIADAIYAAEGKAKERTMYAQLLNSQVKEMEEKLGIPKNKMDGMRVQIISKSGFRRALNSWKYPAMATAAYLTNRKGAWQIDEFRRIDTRGINSTITVLNLPDVARDEIVKNFLSQI